MYLFLIQASQLLIIQMHILSYRNEAWRFHHSFKTEGYKARRAIFRGIQWGFAAFVVTIAIEKVWETVSPSDHSHVHH